MHCGMGRKAPWNTARGSASYCRSPYNRLSRRLVQPGRTRGAPWPVGRGNHEEACTGRGSVGVVFRGSRLVGEGDHGSVLARHVFRLHVTCDLQGRRSGRSVGRSRIVGSGAPQVPESPKRWAEVAGKAQLFAHTL